MTVNLAVNAGERIFINGAVIRFDRVASIELLTDATYLIEQDILQPAETTTTLRQLYFVLQTKAMTAGNEEADRLFEIMMTSSLLAFANEHVLGGLLDVRRLVALGRLVEAMQILRSLFAVEDEILSQGAEPELREAV